MAFADISSFGIPKKVKGLPTGDPTLGTAQQGYYGGNPTPAPTPAQSQVLGTQDTSSEPLPFNVLDYNRMLTETRNASGGSGDSGGGGDYQTTLNKMKSGQMQWDDNLLARLNQSAQSGLDSTMQAIQNKLNLVREQAGKQIERAGGVRDYLVNFINQRYPELQRRVDEQEANTLNEFGTQKTSLQNLYDKANAQARRRSESAALQNRMSARAGNRLGSSFYDQMVQENQENLGRTLGESDIERIAKLAGIDTQTNIAKQDFRNTRTDLDAQKDQAIFAAVEEWKNKIAEAEYLEKAGVADFGAEEAAATQNLQSRLDAIAQWAQGMAQQQQALAAQYGQGGGFDTGLANIGTQTQNFLAQNAQTPAANTLSNLDFRTMGTPQSGNQVSLFANQGIRGTDDILKRLGLA